MCVRVCPQEVNELRAQLDVEHEAAQAAMTEQFLASQEQIQELRTELAQYQTGAAAVTAGGTVRPAKTTAASAAAAAAAAASETSVAEEPARALAATSGNLAAVFTLNLQCGLLFARLIHFLRCAAGIVKAGWIQKQGDFFKSFRRRWFALSITNKLGYYEDRDMTTQRGSVDLFSVTVVRRGQAERDYPTQHVLELVTPRRTYILCCESEADADAWLAVLAPRIQL